MSDQLSALCLFVRVAATGSYSQAAGEHNLTQPMAFRTIALLEEPCLGGHPKLASRSQLADFCGDNVKPVGLWDKNGVVW